MVIQKINYNGLVREVAGVYRMKDSPLYVKIFSELYHGDDICSLSFLNNSNGERVARETVGKYRDLVNFEFYPPETRFEVVRDDMNILTIASYIPEVILLSDSCEDLEINENKNRLKSIAAEVLGVKKTELWKDTCINSNYGFFEGRQYYHDSHVLSFSVMLGEDRKYRRFSLAG